MNSLKLVRNNSITVVLLDHEQLNPWKLNMETNGVAKGWKKSKLIFFFHILKQIELIQFYHHKLKDHVKIKTVLVIPCLKNINQEVFLNKFSYDFPLFPYNYVYTQINNSTTNIKLNIIDIG